MSNVSGSSSNSSRARGRVVGVPKRCRCGESIVAKISKSESNPYRRYFRCSYAATNKLVGDNHTFKWVEEALINEIDAMSMRISRLEHEDEETESKPMMEMEAKLKMEIEEKFTEAENTMKKFLIIAVCACMLMIGWFKYVG